MNSKKWFWTYLISLVILVAGVALVTIIVDPYFHYHKPIDGISYRIYEERYTNNGIAKNFDYDTIIIGTSMTQNFKPSEWDALTGAKTIKLPLSGAGFKEEKEQLERAIQYNPNIKTIIWGIDYDSLLRPYDYDDYFGYPEYLYDENLFNDVNYVLNKDILLHGTFADIAWTLEGRPSTTLDEYASWDWGRGMEAISRNYTRREDIAEMIPGLTDHEKRMVEENMRVNFAELANQYPDIHFIMFYTPYSIVHWDKSNREGWTLRHFDAEEIATRELLKCSNISLFYFNDDFELTCDLENYKDPEHYVAEVNSWMLKQFLSKEYLVTKENSYDRIERAHSFYLSFDYETIFKE